MKNDYIIYGLRDPRTDSYKYIGKSSVGIHRAEQHLVHSHNPEVNIWVRELRVKGLSPIVDILEECDLASLNDKEAFWINFYRGCGLFNVHSLLSIDKKLPEGIVKAEDNMNNLLNQYNTFSKLIKTRRKSLSLKQEDIAEIAGLSIRTIHEIENETGNPTFNNVKKYLDIIGLELAPQIKKLQ